MSDDQILETVTAALSDRRRLAEYADRMYGVMHVDHTLVEYERKIFGVADQISRTCHASASSRSVQA